MADKGVAMPTTEMQVVRFKARATKRKARATTLGIDVGDSMAVVRLVRAGFSYKRLVFFQRATGLPWSEISRFAAIPSRTLTRRQSEGRLQPDESDRVLRASRLFDRASELFEGDREAARKWLRSPQAGLGGETPMDFASTEVGAHEVERLLGRLEHGVFA